MAAQDTSPPKKSNQDSKKHPSDKVDGHVRHEKLAPIVYSAITDLEKILQENDSCPNLSYQTGMLKLAIGLHEESLEHFNTAIRKVDDEDARYYLWKGIALCMGNNYEEALVEFRNAVHNDPTSLECGLYKGRCYLHGIELDRAINTFSNILDESPDGQHEIKFYIGNFFFHHMAYSHARTSYTASARLLNIQGYDFLREWLYAWRSDTRKSQLN